MLWFSPDELDDRPLPRVVLSFDDLPYNLFISHDLQMAFECVLQYLFAVHHFRDWRTTRLVLQLPRRIAFQNKVPSRLESRRHAT